MKPTPWFNRTFPKITDNGQFSSIIERLEGTPIRLEKKVLQFADDFLISCKDDDWSIQEHAGHLLNLEGLWFSRFTDILTGANELTIADLSNQATYDAKYNEQNIEHVLDSFIEVRTQLIQLLRLVKAEDLAKQAIHPRLGTSMKIIDLAYFVAEHDDHHLAMIQQIAAQ